MSDVLQKLEDKVVRLVDELEGLRSKLSFALKEMHDLRLENESLRGRSVNDQEKLQGILSLLDGVEQQAAEPVAVN